ncbi:MAG: exodeoxyribonuclease VII large subunit [Pseudomonadota bacterium]
MVELVEYSVSELASALKRAVEERFSHVRLRGEISGFKRHTSGHCYLSLKDEKAVIDAVIWRGTASALSFRPEDGLEVIAIGKVTTYPARSKYQIVIDHLEPAGVGALMALLEERRRALAAEGLFEAARKKPLPFLPEVIGVVTSPTGAVIRDILHRLADRCPRRVLLWPVAVQGEGAAEQIAAAIAGFNALPSQGPVPRPEVLIVARGGGSLEDLWAFNEEIVVRAAAASAIPLISAVGHETDTTLIDHAADRRAPTPSAAAEMAVPVLAELRYQNEDLAARLARAMARHLAQRGERLKGLARGLPVLRDVLAIPMQRLDELGERLPRALRALNAEKRAAHERVAGRLQGRLLATSLRQHGVAVHELERRLAHGLDRRLERAGARIEASARLLEGLSYERILERGYAVVLDQAARPIVRRVGIRPGDALTLRFHDGELGAIAAAGKPRRAPAKGGDGTPPAQGKLL